MFFSDLEIDTITETDKPVVFVEDTASIFRFNLGLKNTADDRSGNDIHAAVAPEPNFEINAYLSDGDAGAATNPKITLSVTYISPNELSSGLPADGFTAIRGEISVMIEKDKCPDSVTRFICFDVKAHPNANWKDAIFNYKNTKCLNIEDKKKCTPGL